MGEGDLYCCGVMETIEEAQWDQAVEAGRGHRQSYLRMSVVPTGVLARFCFVFTPRGWS